MVRWTWTFSSFPCGRDRDETTWTAIVLTSIQDTSWWWDIVIYFRYVHVCVRATGQEQLRTLFSCNRFSLAGVSLQGFNPLIQSTPEPHDPGASMFSFYSGPGVVRSPMASAHHLAAAHHMKPHVGMIAHAKHELPRPNPTQAHSNIAPTFSAPTSDSFQTSRTIVSMGVMDAGAQFTSDASLPGPPPLDPGFGYGSRGGSQGRGGRGLDHGGRGGNNRNGGRSQRGRGDGGQGVKRGHGDSGSHGRGQHNDRSTKDADWLQPAMWTDPWREFARIYPKAF